MLRQLKNNKGSLLLELAIVIGIIVGVLGAILGLATFSLLASSTVQQTAEAVALAEETLEAIRNYRDGVPWDQDNAGIAYDGLETLVNASSGPYHLVKSSDTPPRWQMASGTEAIGIYTRRIDLEFLERDGNDNIVETGGTDDPDSVEVNVTVSWQERGNTHEIRVVEYLTNWQQF